LDTIQRISRILSREYPNFSLNEIERHVQSYKGGGSGNLVKKPILPLVETPDLINIVVHLMCDGYASNRGTQYYKNTNSSLRKSFLKSLNVFGDVGAREKGDCVFFPICITRILKTIYNIEWGTFKARLPKDLWELPPEFTATAIRAFMDDEGSVCCNGLIFYSFNEKFLGDLLDLIRETFPSLNCSDIRSRKRKTGIEYTIKIPASGFAPFRNRIGSSHSDKIERLEFMIERSKKSWDHRRKGDTKTMILSKLLDRPKTNYELAKDLFICTAMVNSHLRGYKKRGKEVLGLEKLNLVEHTRNERGGFRWKITKRGRASILAHGG